MTEEELINSYNLDQMKRILRTIYFLMSDYMIKNFKTNINSINNFIICYNIVQQRKK